jgi:ubiquinone/menaquinone biosynthesis C-methylase UbiE
MDSTYGALDQFRDAANLSDERARELVNNLETRAKSADEVAARAAYLELLGVGPGQRVLEVGCGTGAVLRDVARRVVPNGRVVGLDPNRTFLAVAAEIAEREGLASLMEWREGDALRLPFPNGSFDVALSVTTLGHVPNGERAITEMVRVVQPGGRVGVHDRDDDSFIVSHPDRALTRRVVAGGSDQAMIDSWLGRKLPRLLTAAGLQDVQIKAFTSLEQNPNGFFANSLRGRARMAAQAGAITSEEHERWLRGLDTEAASGGFVVGLTHLFAWGTRP